jgi:hypothetical protein
MASSFSASSLPAPFTAVSRIHKTRAVFENLPDIRKKATANNRTTPLQTRR